LTSLSTLASAGYDPWSDVVSLASVRSNGGVLLLTVGGKAYFVPAGVEPKTIENGQLAYLGSQTIKWLVPAATGVVTVFSGGGAYFSPDGLNLGGGGSTARAYVGSQSIIGIAAAGTGITTAFSGGAAYFSPTGLSLGGGGNTVRAYAGTQKIVGLSQFEGGVATLFQAGGRYLSPDGLNVGGGGRTIRIPLWTNIAPLSAFGQRDSGVAMVFAGKFWLSTGYFRAPNELYYDLWYSADKGRSWQIALGSELPLTEQPVDIYDVFSRLAVFNGELVAIGSSIWTSPDGLSWRTVTTDGPVKATEDARVIALAGKLVYIKPETAQIFVSADLLHWEESSFPAGFEPRCGAEIVERAGRIWLFGGGRCDYAGSFGEVWYSDDGLRWERLIDGVSGKPVTPPWPGRMWPCMTVGPTGTFWVFGGYRVLGGTALNLSDLWYSKDAIKWYQLKATAGIPLEDATMAPRHAPSCYLDERNALTVVAGKGRANPNNYYGAVQNDVNAITLPDDSSLP
jgi:hypothetical protein